MCFLFPLNYLRCSFTTVVRFLAVTHLVPNPFDPQTSSPPLSVPWTNVSNEFDLPGQTVPLKFGPHGQMVPQSLVHMEKWFQTNLVPVFLDPHCLSPEQMEHSRDDLSRGTKLVVDHLSRGTELFETICPWALNWLGTKCALNQMCHSHNLSKLVLWSISSVKNSSFAKLFSLFF